MKIYLAPIKDLTTAYYRNLFIETFGGIDACYAPFITTTHMRKSDSALFRDILPENNNLSIPLIPQLLGNDSEDFNYFAKNICDLGYKEINWNIGCPAPRIIKKRRGSGLLPYPDDVKDFLDGVCANLTYDLSIKMRLGLNDVEEGQEIIELLNDYPIHSITIHGRTGKMMYSGKSDVDAFASLHHLSQHDLIYNGDIFTPKDYLRIKERFPTLEACMIGRGLLLNPFLPASIKGLHLTAEEKFLKLKAYHDGTLIQHINGVTDEKYLCSKTKEFWFYTSGLFTMDEDLLKEVRRCTTASEYHRISHKLFKCPLKTHH